MMPEQTFVHFAIRQQRDGWHVYFSMDKLGMKKEHVGGPYPTREEALGRTQNAMTSTEQMLGKVEREVFSELAIAPARPTRQCPGCQASAAEWTPDGYWRRGMLCPKCGHEFRE